MRGTSKRVEKLWTLKRALDALQDEDFVALDDGTGTFKQLVYSMRGVVGNVISPRSNPITGDSLLQLVRDAVDGRYPTISTAEIDGIDCWYMAYIRDGVLQTTIIPKSRTIDRTMPRDIEGRRDLWQYLTEGAD